MKRLPGLGLPPLPEKQYSGRFADDFIELRRGDLERWLQRLVRHPVVRVDQCIIGFFGVESEEVSIFSVSWSALLSARNGSSFNLDSVTVSPAHISMRSERGYRG
jgi:hypothetical protein